MHCKANRRERVLTIDLQSGMTDLKCGALLALSSEFGTGKADSRVLLMNKLAIKRPVESQMDLR